jgi:hypothetical protein
VMSARYTAAPARLSIFLACLLKVYVKPSFRVGRV